MPKINYTILSINRWKVISHTFFAITFSPECLQNLLCENDIIQQDIDKLNFILQTSQGWYNVSWYDIFRNIKQILTIQKCGLVYAFHEDLGYES